MFATDLSAAAIARARAGTFPESIEHEVSPERLRRFFVKTDGRYQVSKAIRDACVFAQQDVTRDPPFSKLDLISCCNVLIYLGAALQERRHPDLPLRARSPPASSGSALRRASAGSRTSSRPSTRSTRSTRGSRRPSAHLGFGLTAGDRTRRAAGGAAAEEAGGSAAAIEREADRLILGRYAPAGVVVNADMEIVQFRGKTGPYLEATPGAASFNLFKMAREGLAVRAPPGRPAGGQERRPGEGGGPAGSRRTAGSGRSASR